MRPLIRNIQGKPRPLIMNRRLRCLRYADESVRNRVRRAFGLAYRRPRYLTQRRTVEQEMRTLLTIEAFVGRHSPDPRLVRYYDERARLLRLTNPAVRDEAKRRLAAEGPRCSPADEMHMLSICGTGDDLLSRPEARVTLDRIKRDAEAAVAWLTESAS